MFNNGVHVLQVAFEPAACSTVCKAYKATRLRLNQVLITVLLLVAAVFVRAVRRTLVLALGLTRKELVENLTTMPKVLATDQAERVVDDNSRGNAVKLVLGEYTK